MFRRLLTGATVLSASMVILTAGHGAGGFWIFRAWELTGIVTEASALQQNLKAGMIDPETGKKIKYWVAPMDPTYIRNEPGKSPMGMDLVPVYEDEGEDKEPASTIRIDPDVIWAVQQFAAKIFDDDIRFA